MSVGICREGFLGGRRIARPPYRRRERDWSLSHRVPEARYASSLPVM
jgi:hypothetical protein